MARVQEIRGMAEWYATDIASSPADWMKYLDTAARLYRYSFTDQLLIYAQRPQATACASLELWNEKMMRWVNRGAKGIARYKRYPYGTGWQITIPVAASGTSEGRSACTSF